MRSALLQRYSAAIALVVLALALNVAHFVFEVALEPEPGTWLYWANATFENLQSEAWQIALAAFIFKHLRWSGAPESKPD